MSNKEKHNKSAKKQGFIRGLKIVRHDDGTLRPYVLQDFNDEQTYIALDPVKLDNKCVEADWPIEAVLPKATGVDTMKLMDICLELHETIMASDMVREDYLPLLAKLGDLSEAILEMSREQ